MAHWLSHGLDEKGAKVLPRDLVGRYIMVPDGPMLRVSYVAMKSVSLG